MNFLSCLGGTLNEISWALQSVQHNSFDSGREVPHCINASCALCENKKLFHSSPQKKRCMGHVALALRAHAAPRPLWAK